MSEQSGLFAILKDFADAGLEVVIDHTPKKPWPEEGKAKPRKQRWGVFVIGVPGTDMLVCGGRAATFEEAANKALDQVPDHWYPELEIPAPIRPSKETHG